MANLSPAEKALIQCFVDEVTIMYDVVCKDGSEAIALGVKINGWKDKWTMHHIARAVASSFPYECLIYAEYGTVARVFAFKMKESQSNNRRAVIEKMYATPQFMLRQPYGYVNHALKGLRISCQKKPSSAVYLSAKWRVLIAESVKAHRAHFGI